MDVEVVAAAPPQIQTDILIAERHQHRRDGLTRDTGTHADEQINDRNKIPHSTRRSSSGLRPG